VETGQDIFVFLKKGHKWFEDKQGSNYRAEKAPRTHMKDSQWGSSFWKSSFYSFLIFSLDMPSFFFLP